MTASLWLFGLLVGMRHALEPDHLAAVSTLVVEQRRVGSGAVLGGFWGLGHTVALLAVTTTLALVGAALPTRLATVFELGVALMLVAMGLRSMARGRRRAHVHAGASVAAAGADASTTTGGRWGFARRSVLVGLVHGLAGSGALTALLASRLPSTTARLIYVLLFGLGSVMGMAFLSGVAGWPLSRLGRRPVIARILTVGTGVFAFGLGIVWGVPLVRELIL